MNKKRVESCVSFADSEYKAFKMLEDSTLLIYMKSWQEEPFKVIFTHAIQFLYKLGDVPKGLYEISNHSTFLIEALTREYIQLPTEHPYKLYQIEDIEYASNKAILT
jgi:hypothetical protein